MKEGEGQRDRHIDRYINRERERENKKLKVKNTVIIKNYQKPLTLSTPSIYYYYYWQNAKPLLSNDNLSEILGHLSECMCDLTVARKSPDVDT